MDTGVVKCTGRSGLQGLSTGGSEGVNVGASKSVTNEASEGGTGCSGEKETKVDETKLFRGATSGLGVVADKETNQGALEPGGVDCTGCESVKPTVGGIDGGEGLEDEGNSALGQSGEGGVSRREGMMERGGAIVGGSVGEVNQGLDVDMGGLTLAGEVLEEGCELMLSQPIARALSCSICQGILLDAYKCLECMHSYCYTCVRSRVEIGDPRNVCPVEKCGRHDIDGFTPTCLGPNPFDPVKPKLLPDSLLSGIVKKVFGFGSCPPSPNDTDESDEMEFDKPEKEEPFGVGLADFKSDSMLAPSLVAAVDTDTQDWNHLTPSFVSGFDPPVASMEKVRRKRAKGRTVERKPRQAAIKAKSAAGGSQVTPRKGSTSGKSVGRKRGGSKGVTSPTKRLHGTAQSLVDLALFPIDALDKSQALPALQCNYFKIPGTVLVEFLLKFVREELQSPRLVLFCGDRLLMPDAKKSLEWVRKEVWLPRDEHQDIFTLYYSNHTSLPDGHWLRGN